MWSCSLEFKNNGKRIAPIAWSSYMRCSDMQLLKGRRRWNGSSAKARWQNLPQLNPEAGIPTVQLVGPETTKEELLELYLEVYKLHRLPGSPLGELAILKEVLSSLPDHQRHEEEEAPTAMAWPCAEGPHSSRSHAPPQRKERKLGGEKSGHSV